MNFRGESIPQFGDSLQDEIGTEHSHLGGSNIKFAKPISSEEFEEKKIIEPIIAEIADFVDKAQFIPADLYTKAQTLNDPFLNDYILSLPDDTVVFLDSEGNETRTIFQIKETADALNKQRNIEHKKEDAPQVSPSIKNESTSGTLEGLLSIAETKEDLIAIVSKSNDLRDGLWGTQQTYSRDELIALIEATWNGEVGIDHLPRTAGFRDAVDRIRENERSTNLKIAKQKTAKELIPAMEATIEIENRLGVPEDQQIYGHDKKNNSFVYNYTNSQQTEEDRNKNSGIFSKLWAVIKRKI